MYLAIFGSPVVLTAVAGAAAALIYEYYAFKYRERESSLNRSAYSALGSEHLERNSVDRTDLRRRKHRIDGNPGSSSHTRTEVNERESIENSDLNVLKVAQHSVRDVKLVDDVIRNSECIEKHYEKNVFNKVKNDLSKLNQNFEEKIISEKNIYDSSCVNCEYKATEALNSSVKSKPLVIKVGEIRQNHSNCEEDTFYDSLDNLNDIAACSKGYDEYEINQIGIAKPNCSDRISDNSENRNQTPKNITDNDNEAESFIGIVNDAYHDNPKYLLTSPYVNEFKNDGVHQYCQEMNCKGSNFEETEVFSNSVCENLYQSSTVKNKLLAKRNDGVKHKFNNINKNGAVIELDEGTLNSQFEKRKNPIKCQNQARQIKLLNVDSSYECSPCAALKDQAYYNGLQSSSVTTPTVGLNEHMYHSSLQPGVDLKGNTYHSSLQPSFSSACNKETHTKVNDRHKLYNQYKKRIVLDNKRTKMLNDTSVTECVSSKSAIKNSLDFMSHPQFSFNTVSNIEIPKHIAQMEFHDQCKKNLSGEKSNVKNIITSSTVDQHPTLSSIEEPKSTIYLRTAEHAFYVSGKEKSNGIVDYQVTDQSKILSVHASPTFVSHLCHKFMPGLQSYVSNIRKFVKNSKALLSETNNSNSASSSIENDTKITEAKNVDIGCQSSLVCDKKSEELNSHTVVKPQQMLCKGCMEVLANTISVPCGHSYFCMQCAEITSKIYKKCCICHNHVTSFKLMIV